MNDDINLYFPMTVKKIWGDCLFELGATCVPTLSSEIIRYSTSEWFTDILYLPTDGPRYCPRVEIGCKPEHFVDPRRNRVDIMHVVPDDLDIHHYNLRWTYKSKSELESTMAAVRDKVFSIYATPYLKDTNRLRELIVYRNDVVEKEWQQKVNDHNDSVWRAKAEEAFSSKIYLDAIQYFEKIPPERRTKIDESKIRYARKSVN